MRSSSISLRRGFARRNFGSLAETQRGVIARQIYRQVNLKALLLQETDNLISQYAILEDSTAQTDLIDCMSFTDGQCLSQDCHRSTRVKDLRTNLAVKVSVREDFKERPPVAAQYATNILFYGQLNCLCRSAAQGLEDHRPLCFKTRHWQITNDGGGSIE